VREDAALEVSRELALDKWEAVPLWMICARSGEKGLEVILDDRMQDRAFGFSTPIGRSERSARRAGVALVRSAAPSERVVYGFVRDERRRS